MLQTYEAIYNGNQFRWINPPPKVNKEVHVWELAKVWVKFRLAFDDM